MIDLPLMARLLAALPPQARVILLGDKDQLSSVEAGSVFADISGDRTGVGFSASFAQRLQQFSGQEIEPDQINAEVGFTDCVVQLQKSYRFDPDSGIGALATAINQGDSQSVLQLLGRETRGLTYLSPRNIELEVYLDAQLIPAYTRCFAAASAQDAIEQFNSLRILCALRKTATGVEAINHSIETSLKRNGSIRTEEIHYQGRPILITRNDHNLGLFNGDTGVLWPDPEANDQLRAWFISPDNSFRRVLPSRLPQHETAYAMTIHKSQGSEFERVLIVLPPDSSDLLTRELLYTGVTRARNTVEIWGLPEVIRRTVEARVKRNSGLAQKLYA
jgi:exodeoxyribonuclease V alpha subunit